ncbi:MAG: PD-(D/E)XK nuclease family protein [Eubacteriales bacterium]|nr:PD-(D/E)XK nuclease family protein [Eubacteriales bacterium]
MRFICGADPRAILDLCLQEIADFTSEYPLRRAFLLVPESLKAESERRYLEHFGSGLMMAEVLSFKRFAERVFAQAGTVEGRPLSALGKRLKIRQIISRNKAAYEKLQLYATRSDSLEELASVLADFERHCVSAEELRESAANYARPAARQLAELAQLNGEYRAELAREGLFDPVELPARLTELIKSTEPFSRQRSEFIESSVFWIAAYGDLRQLTQQELELITALEERGAELNLALVAALPGKAKDFANSTLSEESLARVLASLGKGAKLEFQGLGEAAERAWAERPARALSAYLLGASEEAPELGAFQANLIHAENRYLAAEFLAGEIKRILVQGESRRKKIAVALLEPEDEELLQRVFASYGLDSDFNSPLGLKASALYQYLEGFFAILAGEQRLEQLSSFFRNRLRPQGLDPAQLDRLENLALAQGWKYWSVLEREFTKFLKEPEAAFDFLRQGEDYQAIVDSAEFQDLVAAKALITRFLNRLREAQKKIAKSKDGAALINEFIEVINSDFGPYPALNDLLEAQIVGAENREAELTALSWQSLVEILAELSALYAEPDAPPLSLAEFSDLVLSTLADTAAPRIPLGLDRITIARPRQLLQKDLDYLFIFNSSNTSLPPPLPAEGLLKSAERIYLKEYLGTDFPNFKEDHLASSRYLLAQFFALPKKALSFIHCNSIQLYAPETGPAKVEGDRLSRFELKFAERYPAGVQAVTAIDLPDQRALAEPVAKRLLRLYGELYPAEVQASWGLAELEELPRDDLQSPRPELLLPADLAHAAMLNLRGLSASSLERISACPYSGYISYFLKARERAEAKPDPRRRGSFIHRALELVLPAFPELQQELAKLRLERQASVVEQIAYLEQNVLPELYAKVAAESGQKIWLDPEVRGDEGRRLERLLSGVLYHLLEDLEKKQKGPKFRAAAAEWDLPRGEAALYLDFLDYQLPLAGTVDRIDIAETDKSLASAEIMRVLDYKTGQRSVDIEAINCGLSLQLPIYIHAVKNAFPQAEITEAGLYRLHNKRSGVAELGQLDEQKGASYLSRSSLKNAADCEAAEASGLSRAAEIMTDFAAGRISPRPRILAKDAGSTANLPCRYCQYKAICNYDRLSALSRSQVLKAEDFAEPKEVKPKA